MYGLIIYNSALNIQMIFLMLSEETFYGSNVSVTCSTCPSHYLRLID